MKLLTSKCLLCYGVNGWVVMKNTHNISYILILLFFVSSCAPEIISFQAIPKRICVGQQTTLSWDIRGNGNLKIKNTQLVGNNSVPQQGSAVYMLLETTTFELRAMKKGKDDKYEVEGVKIVSDGNEVPVVLDIEETIIDNQLIAMQTPREDLWGNVEIGSIHSNEAERVIHVVYGGREVILSTDGTKSNKLEGLKMGGLWKIYAELLPGESIENSDLPVNFQIIVSISCPKKEG